LTMLTTERRVRVASLLAAAAAAGWVFSITLLHSEADVAVQAQPASEGRPITPAGRLVIDLTTRRPAVGSLPVEFVRSPDHSGPNGQGRYLIAVNSGYGIQFNSATNKGQQSLAVIDLNATPEPMVIQNVYFPTPQSVNVGVAFSQKPDNRSYALYAAGGFENRIWIFRFTPGSAQPITPPSPGPATSVTAPYIDVSGFSNEANTTRYNSNRLSVYPTGLALSPDGNSLYVANNLADNLGIVTNLHGSRNLVKVDLRRAGSSQFIYPYGVAVVGSKAYVSCWGDATVAVVNVNNPAAPVRYITVDRHPTSVVKNRMGTRLFVANSDADTVSVIDTTTDLEIERISVRVSESALVGSSPEGLALSQDEATLYAANAHSNAIAVVELSAAASRASGSGDWDDAANKRDQSRSRVRGFIPTGQYPSAVAVVDRTLFVGNGKGTGFESSSLVVDNGGRFPNMPNDRFPASTGRQGRGGQYSLSLIAGNISAITEPDEKQLAAFTGQVMRNDGLVQAPKSRLFNGPSPIKHVIYIIKENRTYDQVFGDVQRGGNGAAADGDPRLAIFGAGEAARRPGGAAQDIAPNHRALALRFGLMDRFFVNAAASPEGHNWSTAGFSNDYVDKAYRWNYSSRGRAYDFEGFNRLPAWGAERDEPPMFATPISVDDVVGFLKGYIPYLNGARDIAEPETLYLWDAAARAGLTYRNYGEFVATVSEATLSALNENKQRPYPDISRTLRALPTKKSLEGHVSETFRNFDLRTPDSMTPDSYRAAKGSEGKVDPLISWNNADERFRGSSRFSEWFDEFRGYVADIEAGKPDRMPNFSMMRFSNDHTSGLSSGYPTPQFYMAENDYAVGKLVEAVSNSPYWRDTAIFILEDDAQDGPDHVDCHRSPALVVSAYNKPGGLIHDFHNTVSLIRTMEILLGMQPMNQLDASVAPIDIFRDDADLRPYKALLPEVSLDNLINPAPAGRDSTRAYWMKRTGEQNLSYPDMADPRVMNEIIWFSVRGEGSTMPEPARLAVVDAMRESFRDMTDRDDEPSSGNRKLARR
jgi:YVTN family beta-propeller protein